MQQIGRRCSSLFTSGNLCCVAVLVFSACVSPKEVRYFQNLSDSSVVHLPLLQKPQPVIMPDDVLEIKIAGANEATAALLNTYSSSTSAAGTSSPGYAVDGNGDIEFPVVGKIKAAGFTKEEFKEKLKEKIGKYLKDPLISVRFTNFRFTVLGEVKTPGNFSVAGEKVTVLDALGFAGDMTTYSHRSKVRVVRDSSGNREIGVLDFTDKSVFMSKYYYLQRNDVVYVEAQKTKSQTESLSRVSAVLATVASLIAITITILK